MCYYTYFWEIVFSFKTKIHWPIKWMCKCNISSLCSAGEAMNFSLKSTHQSTLHRFLHSSVHSSVVFSVFLSLILCYFIWIRSLLCKYGQSHVCFIEIKFFKREGVEHPTSFVETSRKRRSYESWALILARGEVYRAGEWAQRMCELLHCRIQ